MSIDIYQDNIFDIEKIEPVIFASTDAYHDFCKTVYFDACRSSSVLEIGAGNGNHSLNISRQNPSRFVIIEGDSRIVGPLKDIAGVEHVITDDVMMALKDQNFFDVVICLGVLYHLHSPLHLLELIANNCRPSIVILDCVMAPKNLEFVTEDQNVPGNSQVRPNWRSCNMNLVAPFLTYLQSMDNLGYVLDKVHRIQVKNYFPKNNSWMASWRIKK